VATGTVVRFDDNRGYGFVTPDTGGEDVFIHANDLMVDKSLITPGAKVEFVVEDGDRGLKASKVRIVEHNQVVALPAQRHGTATDDDGLCDVLSSQEFLNEVTEILLTAAPGATADQVVRIRQSLIGFAARHGWIEG
jgi:cold shock CspA family protein